MKKKYTCIDLFCGCGGLSKGFELAGFDIRGGIDFNKAAIQTFNHNFKNGKGLCCDILNVDKEYILQQFDNFKDIDVIVGGPPCQGFSSANRYNKEGEDPRNKLFFEFMKFVDIAHPAVVVIENARGIVTNNNGYAKDRIKELFEKRDYKVAHQILDASMYGVPQKRLRNFFVMTKKKKFDFNAITRKNQVVTVREALADLYEFDSNEHSYKAPRNQNPYLKYLRSGATGLKNHEVRYPAEIVQRRISFVQQGHNWQDVPENLWPSKRNNRHSSAYKRLDENTPSVTIDTGNNHSNYFHPLYNRIPTVREAARLQSFPDNFEFCGNRSEQYRQVGNAVPPLLAKAIAEEIIKGYLK